MLHGTEICPFWFSRLQQRHLHCGQRTARRGWTLHKRNRWDWWALGCLPFIQSQSFVQAGLSAMNRGTKVEGLSNRQDGSNRKNLQLYTKPTQIILSSVFFFLAKRPKRGLCFYWHTAWLQNIHQWVKIFLDELNLWRRLKWAGYMSVSLLHLLRLVCSDIWKPGRFERNGPNKTFSNCAESTVLVHRCAKIKFNSPQWCSSFSSLAGSMRTFNTGWKVQANFLSHRLVALAKWSQRKALKFFFFPSLLRFSAKKQRPPGMGRESTQPSSVCVFTEAHRLFWQSRKTREKKASN